MDQTKAITFLRQFPVFENLQQEDYEYLARRVQLKTVPKFGYIYMPDEPSNYIYFLIKGTVKIGIHSADAKEVIKSILHPLAMFGELGIVGEETRQDFAIAMNNEVNYYALHIDDFNFLMRNNYNVSLKILQIVGARLKKAESRLESLVFKDARTRIIDFLKESADKRGRQIGYEMLVKHSLTQQDIANITGTSRQTVTSVLNELKKANLIYFNRRSILIRDMNQLV